MEGTWLIPEDPKRKNKSKNQLNVLQMTTWKLSSVLVELCIGNGSGSLLITEDPKRKNKSKKQLNMLQMTRKLSSVLVQMFFGNSTCTFFINNTVFL